jgi:tRNA-specific adenosine deaminase 2
MSNDDPTRHRKYMKLALQMAQKAYEAGEVPVGCVFIHNDSIMASAGNETNKTRNATKHAEIICLENLDCDLVREMDLYVTIEPCIMCAAALRESGIKHVYYGAGNDRFGGCGTVLNIHSDPSEYPPYSVTSGIYEKEAIMMLRKFYITENDTAPNPRKKKNRKLKFD